MTPLFKSLTVAASLALSVSLPAFADQASEDYVRENANHALSMLNDPELDSLERREAFQGLMNQFTDLERVSRFVIGRYARVFNDQEFDAYYDAYARYALATYEAELDKYRGEEIVVTGSTDRNDRDSIVETVVRRPTGDLPVRWRVLSTDDGEDQLPLKERMKREIRGEIRSYMEVGQMLTKPLSKTADKVNENASSASCIVN